MPPKRAAKGEKKKNDENAASGSGRANESEASGSGLTNEIAEPGRGGGRKRSATAKANKRILAEKNDSESGRAKKSCESVLRIRIHSDQFHFAGSA